MGLEEKKKKRKKERKKAKEKRLTGMAPTRLVSDSTFGISRPNKKKQNSLVLSHANTRYETGDHPIHECLPTKQGALI